MSLNAVDSTRLVVDDSTIQVHLCISAQCQSFASWMVHVANVTEASSH